MAFISFSTYLLRKLDFRSRMRSKAACGGQHEIATELGGCPRHGRRNTHASLLGSIPTLHVAWPMMLDELKMTPHHPYYYDVIFHSHRHIHLTISTTECECDHKDQWQRIHIMIPCIIVVTSFYFVLLTYMHPAFGAPHPAFTHNVIVVRLRGCIMRLRTCMQALVIMHAVVCLV